MDQWGRTLGGGTGYDPMTGLVNGQQPMWRGGYAQGDSGFDMQSGASPTTPFAGGGGQGFGGGMGGFMQMISMLMQNPQLMQMFGGGGGGMFGGGMGQWLGANGPPQGVSGGPMQMGDRNAPGTPQMMNNYNAQFDVGGGQSAGQGAFNPMELGQPYGQQKPMQMPSFGVGATPPSLGAGSGAGYYTPGMSSTFRPK